MSSASSSGAVRTTEVRASRAKLPSFSISSSEPSCLRRATRSPNPSNRARPSLASRSSGLASKSRGLSRPANRRSCSYTRLMAETRLRSTPGSVRCRPKALSNTRSMRSVTSLASVGRSALLGSKRRMSRSASKATAKAPSSGMAKSRAATQTRASRAGKGQDSMRRPIDVKSPALVTAPSASSSRRAAETAGGGGTDSHARCVGSATPIAVKSRSKPDRSARSTSGASCSARALNARSE